MGLYFHRGILDGLCKAGCDARGDGWYLASYVTPLFSKWRSTTLYQHGEAVATSHLETCPIMPSFTSFAKTVVLANRITITRRASFHFGSSQNRAVVETDPDHTRAVLSLPLGISERIPQELYERFIEHLCDDRVSLARCSLVCRAWWPASRYHMKRSLAVLPEVIVANAEALSANCACPLR